jgi:peptidoglycan/xylan/chitin deacetylase (PgdA/CDA1 family)
MTHTTFGRAAVLGWTTLACAGSGFAAPLTSKLPLVPKPPQHHKHLPQNSPANSLSLSPNLLPPSASLALVQAERDKYWLNAKHEVYRSTLELVAQDQTDLLRGLHLDKVLRGDPNRREIALTIDDGPHPIYTLKLLQILKENGIPATFFVVGEKAEEYPELIRAEVAGGHEIGNHTYDHVSLIKIPPEYIDTEIEACGEVLKKITGKPSHLFRPPGGEYNQAVAEAVEALGYKMILYSDDPGDYADPGTGVIEMRTLDTISNGGIILLHDGSAQTLLILPQIIQRLKARGFHFVTVDALLRPGG